MRVSDSPVRERLERGVNGDSPAAESSAYRLCASCHERAFPDRTSALAKRVVDVVLAVAILLVLAPLMLLTAIVIKLESSGPVFFRQPRLGLDMRPFRMWKFRTMWSGVSSEAHRRYIADLVTLQAQNGNGLRKLTDDRRVTRVGRFLRKISIDELPQLFNVLLGHMSLIGPRPALQYELEHYAPYHFDRFLVRPGLTGLWQVSGRSQLNFLEMLELDVEYARHATLRGDLRILVRTPRAALGSTA